MNRRSLLVGCLAIILIFGALVSSAERSSPNVVGGNAYKKRAEEPTILPLTFAEIEEYLSRAMPEQLGNFCEELQLESCSWATESARSVISLEGDAISVDLKLSANGFTQFTGSCQTSEFTERTRNKEIAEINSITWRSAAYTDLPRQVTVGASLETLLSAYGITQISNEGLIYDNDLLYADEGSEDSDYAYHPEQHAIIYCQNGRTILEFTAYQEYATHCYVLSYGFKGEKIETVTLKKGK